MLLISKWIKSSRHPSGLCFPACCFCRILISFGCVNLLSPLNQHHPVCTVSAHLVTLILREPTLWTKLVWFASAHWDVNSYCILSLPYSLTALFSPIWLESTVLYTASSPCLNVLISSSAFLSLLCALIAREAASITAVNPFSDASLPAAVRTCQCLLPRNLLPRNLSCTNLFERFAPNVRCFPHWCRNKRFHAWHKHLARPRCGNTGQLGAVAGLVWS